MQQDPFIQIQQEEEKAEKRLAEARKKHEDALIKLEQHLKNELQKKRTQKLKVGEEELEKEKGSLKKWFEEEMKSAEKKVAQMKEAASSNQKKAVTHAVEAFLTHVSK